MLGKIITVGSTLAAPVVLAIGVGWLAVDTLPLMKNAIGGIDPKDINILIGIGSLGLGAVLFSKLIAKPFDKMMDAMYPDDIKPK